MNIVIPKTPQEAHQVMSNIMQGKHTTNEVVEFLKFYQLAPPSIQYLRAFMEAIKEEASYLIDTKEFRTPMIDIAGTGGDCLHTVNISTLASIFSAATGLVTVAKYGNRAASGMCGSMDVLEANNIPIALSFQQIHENLKTTGFSPVFARSVYPGANYVANARAQLTGSTIFNVLFPLVRPFRGKYGLLFGIADKKKLGSIAQIYIQDKRVRCLVVHGFDGTDEVSTTGSGKTEYIFIDQGSMTKGIIQCQKYFGFQPTDLTELQVSSKEEAIEYFLKVCDPHIQSPRMKAIRQSVYANAAIALFIGLDTNSTDLKSAKKYLAVLEETFQSGRVLNLIQQLQANGRKI